MRRFLLFSSILLLVSCLNTNVKPYQTTPIGTHSNYQKQLVLDMEWLRLKRGIRLLSNANIRLMHQEDGVAILYPVDPKGRSVCTIPNPTNNVTNKGIQNRRTLLILTKNRYDYFVLDKQDYFNEQKVIKTLSGLINLCRELEEIRLSGYHRVNVGGDDYESYFIGYQSFVKNPSGQWERKQERNLPIPGPITKTKYTNGNELFSRKEGFDYYLLDKRKTTRYNPDFAPYSNTPNIRVSDVKEGMQGTYYVGYKGGVDKNINHHFRAPIPDRVYEFKNNNVMSYNADGVPTKLTTSVIKYGSTYYPCISIRTYGIPDDNCYLLTFNSEPSNLDPQVSLIKPIGDYLHKNSYYLVEAQSMDLALRTLKDAEPLFTIKEYFGEETVAVRDAQKKLKKANEQKNIHYYTSLSDAITDKNQPIYIVDIPNSKCGITRHIETYGVSERDPSSPTLRFRYKDKEGKISLFFWKKQYEDEESSYYDASTYLIKNHTPKVEDWLKGAEPNKLLKYCLKNNDSTNAYFNDHRGYFSDFNTDTISTSESIETWKFDGYDQGIEHCTIGTLETQMRHPRCKFECPVPNSRPNVIYYTRSKDVANQLAKQYYGGRCN